MNKFKILGFLIAMISISLFTNTDSQANAAEIEEELDSNVTFDITKNELQESTFIDDEGNEITFSIEPIVKQISIFDAGYLFPYGTSSYKVKGSNRLLTVTYYIDVNVPKSNINNSKILDAYDEDYFCFGCTISDPELDHTSKTATFTCTTSFLGNTSNSNRLRVTLNGNALTIDRDF